MIIDSAVASDLEAVESLLTVCHLPLEGVRDHFADFLVARVSSAAGAPMIGGCAGLERHGATWILRSLAVSHEHRGAGLGRRLMEAALSRAQAAGCHEIVLLTLTIERMATRQGFERIQRDQVPAPARNSAEFTINACATAIVMRRRL